MAHQPPSPATGDDSGAGADRRPIPGYPGTPRWVKVFGIIALILVLLAVFIFFAGRGGHSPGRHIPYGGNGSHTVPIAHGVRQP
jgi:hypothetical protein